jgi:hypothetical protein
LNCNGTWYCWSDSAWHCAPPDSGPPGGPGDATVQDSTPAGTGDGASNDDLAAADASFME